MNRKPKKYKHFYCRKHSFYGSCTKCIALNGSCDYEGVFQRENKPKFNPCPICEYKNTDKCSACKEQLYQLCATALTRPDKSISDNLS